MTEPSDPMSDTFRLLVEMSERSRRKLTSPRNLAKGSWVEMTDFEIRQRIRDEMEELAVEIGLSFTTEPLDDVSVDWEKVANEAADVYHFASMGADPSRRSR